MAERHRRSSGGAPERCRHIGDSHPGVCRGAIEDLLKAYGWGMVHGFFFLTRITANGRVFS